MSTLAQAPLAQTQEVTDVGSRLANILIFVGFVVVTLVVVFKASKRNATASEYYTGGSAVHRPAERHCHLR